MSYVAQIGDFMSGDFMSGDFLTWIQLIISRYKTSWNSVILSIWCKGAEVVGVKNQGPKCLLQGAEVSFHEGPKCLDKGPKCLFQKGPKCPIGAEVVGAEVSKIPNIYNIGWIYFKIR